MKKTVLREYAKLIAKVGANVQKGQEVFIQSVARASAEEPSSVGSKSSISGSFSGSSL